METKKRAFDFFCAIALLVLLSPLFVFIAFAIWVTSGRPIFFTQERVGKDGELFTIYKFRTLSHNTGGVERDIVCRGDARLTRVGEFIRFRRLDELPNLFNVLGGTMSMVGPRPLRVKDFEYLLGRVPYFSARVSVKPGVTSAGKIVVVGEKESLNAIEHDRDEYRKDYRHLRRPWSLKADLYVLIKTLSVPFKKNCS